MTAPIAVVAVSCAAHRAQAGASMTSAMYRCAVSVMARRKASIRSAEAVQAAVYMLVFPLGFTSAVFVPVATMPGWLQAFAAHQPVTVVADAMRGLMLGPDALPAGHTVTGEVFWTLGWSALIVVVFAPLAVRAYRRA